MTVVRPKPRCGYVPKVLLMTPFKVQVITLQEFPPGGVGDVGCDIYCLCKGIRAKQPLAHICLGNAPFLLRGGFDYVV